MLSVTACLSRMTCLVAVTSCVTGASAQWTVDILHPAEATDSQALAVADGNLVGWCEIDGKRHAYVWAATTLTGVDLHPLGAHSSEATGTSQGLQVGTVYTQPNTTYASAWTGSPNSVQQLHATNSAADGVYRGRVVGWVGNVGAAMLPELGSSWIYLTNGDPGGRANATHGRVTGGRTGTYSRATIWLDGRQGGAISLHTLGHVESSVLGVYGNEQVGYSTAVDSVRAVLWRGTPGATYLAGDFSFANAVFAGQQVGRDTPQTGYRATRWTGDAPSAVDLHDYLPAGYSSSNATGVWDDSEAFTYVSGYASSSGTSHAVLWKSENIHKSQITAMEIVRGSVVSGGLQSIQTSDDERLRIRPGIVFSTQQAPVQLIVEGTVAVVAPKRISLSIESSGTSILKQRIDFFNFQSGSYEVFSDDAIGTSDDIFRADVSLNVSRYIQLKTGKLRARLSYFRELPAFAFPWEARIDRVWWHMVGV